MVGDAVRTMTRELERVADGAEGDVDLVLEQAEGGDEHDGDEGDDEGVLDQPLAFLLGHNIVHGAVLLCVLELLTASFLALTHQE